LKFQTKSACITGATMKLLTQYLERALKFESLAAAETDQKLKVDLEGQASAYRKLASDRATKLGLPQPSAPTISNAEHFAPGTDRTRPAK
jgi:hypothetical protein